MKVGKIGLGATLAALCCVPAQAQDSGGQGFYGSIRAGSQWLNNVKAVAYAPAGTLDDLLDGGEGGIDDGGEGLLPTGTVVPTGADTLGGKLHTKSGVGIQGELGYDFGMIRTGLELGYGRNKVNGATIDSLNGAAVPDLDEDQTLAVCDYLSAGVGTFACDASGGTFQITGAKFAKIRQFAMVASVWIDIPTGSAFEPYIGGGAGLVDYNVKMFGESDGKTKFAWHLGAGVAYHFTDNLAFTVDYRYRQVKGGALFDDGDGYGVALGKLKTQNLSAGLRIGF